MHGVEIILRPRNVSEVMEQIENLKNAFVPGGEPNSIVVKVLGPVIDKLKPLLPGLEAVLREQGPFPKYEISIQFGEHKILPYIGRREPKVTFAWLNRFTVYTEQSVMFGVDGGTVVSIEDPRAVPMYLLIVSDKKLPGDVQIVSVYNDGVGLCNAFWNFRTDKDGKTDHLAYKNKAKKVRIPYENIDIPRIVSKRLKANAIPIAGKDHPDPKVSVGEDTTLSVHTDILLDGVLDELTKDVARRIAITAGKGHVKPK